MFWFEPLTVYCADCGKPFGKARARLLGRLVACPHDPLHYCRVVKPPMGMFWLRVERGLRNYEYKWSVRHWLWYWGGLFRGPAERYHVLFWIVLAATLVLLNAFPSLWTAIAAIVIAAVLVADNILDFTSVAFVTRYPASQLRSAALVMSGFGRFCLAWAIAYSAVAVLQPGQFDRHLGVLTAIYFSVVTVTTTGYGDIVPLGNTARSLAIIQILSGLYLLTAILAIIVGWANERPQEPEPLPLEEAALPEGESDQAHE